MSDKIVAILDRARWAPSGDNCQPWKFEFTSENSVRIHVFHDASNIYEWGNGKPSWISVGALIENIRLASSSYGLFPEVSDIRDIHHGSGSVDILFHDRKTDVDSPIDSLIDSLADFIEDRTVTRTPFRRTDITDNIAADLQAAVGSGFIIDWHTGWRGKLKMIRINGLATHIRLKIREAFDIHRKVIDWDHTLSPDKIPAVALGFSPLNLFFTKWAMKSWTRVNFMNRFFAGAVFPQIELDVLPGLFCARHFSLFRLKQSSGTPIQDLLEAGAAIQRLWLCATKNGLAFQPSMAPLIFASHSKAGTKFSDDEASLKRAEKLADLMTRHASHPFDRQVFQGRIGYPARKNPGRSIRKSLSDLVQS